MPNVMPIGVTTFRQTNNYCPACMYAADVNYNGETRCNFGAPAVAVATLVANAVSMSAVAVTDLSGVAQFPEPWGRSVTIVASGAYAGVVTLRGYDYLGQPIREDLTCNGATPVLGKKAFKSFISMTSPTTGAVTVNIGNGAQLGLPYKTLRAQFETANGVAVAAGTLTQGALTDPATATTGDPRGTYAPTTAFDGTTVITASFDCANDVNAANHGGLHGIQQFNG